MKKFNILLLSDFSWLVLSALGFSFALVIIRIYGNASVLREALNLQSYVIIISFLAQLGSRALVRRLIYSRLRHLASILVANTSVVLLVLSPVGFLVSYAFGLECFWCVSILLALNTLYLAESVAKKRHKQIAGYSLLNFLVAGYGGLLYLYFGVNGDTGVYFIIEAISIILIFFIVILRKPRFSFKLKKYFQLLNAAQSYQLGSINISLMMFFVMQGAIVAFSDDREIASYADLQIIAGSFSLVAGKLMLLLEKKIYKASVSRVSYFVFILILTLCVSCLSAIFLHFYRDVSVFSFFLVSWTLFSRIVIGYVVQYIEKLRRILDLVSFLSIIYFFVAWIFLPKSTWFAVSFWYSFLYVCFGTLLLFRDRKRL